MINSLSSGAVMVVDAPAPRPRAGHLLIRSDRTLISAGTERMLVEFGRSGWISKARQQPEKVREVLNKISSDGLLPTLDAVTRKLDQPITLGYCNAGTVVDVGAGVRGFAIGDRVASNGPHAELVCVPQNLCARIPDGVTADAAAFTVIGAIALQGIRLAQPTLGESVVVTGLGLVGLLAVQLLLAQGCRVLGLDYDGARLAMARKLGAETVDLASGVDALAAARAFSRQRGVDAVILTAATDSSEPVRQAAAMCRKRGRIVLVGVTGLELARSDFYEKEITFQVSCSYGPGRYDATYEEQGHDYPAGFVRWTAQRNFEAFLDMLAAGRVKVESLVTHRFDISEAATAYDALVSDRGALGILLGYSGASGTESEDDRGVRTVPITSSRRSVGATGPSVSVIGAGNYAGAVLIPAFMAAGARARMIAGSGGVGAVHLGQKFGFEQATSDVNAVLDDERTDIVVISTRHDSHAELVCEALRRGKHVFVEKPLALTDDELRRVEAVARSVPDQVLTVGFNRRFAPHVQKMRQLMGGVTEPRSLVMTVNAGHVPASHWTQDPAVGGGRLLGEGCHFIDLLRFLAESPVEEWRVLSMESETRDSASTMLRFENGSLGVVHYLSNGSKSFPKERLEVFAAGRVLQLDNFRRLKGYGWPGFSRMRLWRQDKGQGECVGAFLQAVRSGAGAPIPLDELIEVARVTIEVAGAAH